MSNRIAIVGVGTMGEAVLAGLVGAGHDPAGIVAGVRRSERGTALEEQYGVTARPTAQAAGDADVVILGVKPYDVVTVLGSLAPTLRPGTLVVSLAAGITTAAMEAVVPSGVAVVRVMPNTPSLVGEGMSVLAPGATAAEEHVAVAERLLAAIGRVVTVTEKQIDAAAAISGSGPAYVFLVAEALVEAGVHLGLPRAVSTELVNQTLVGSSLLLRDTSTHPAVLREQVTSPGGTTAAALRELEAHRLRSAFLEATRANAARSAELGQA